MEEIFVGSLMSSPVHTVTPNAPLQRAAETMLDQDISSVVVTEDDGHLAGILTTTDFVRAGADDRVASETDVIEYASTDVETTTANDSIRDAADTMVELGCHHLPVVDESESVIGIITTTDLTMYLSRVRTPSPTESK